jgi:integrase/recombinase XerD
MNDSIEARQMQQSLRSSRLSWDQALEDFASHQRAANLAEKTISNRAAMLRHLAKRSGRQPVDVQKSDLQEMLSRKHRRSEDRLTPGTMQAERSYMQCFFAWLKDEGHTEHDPAQKLARIKMVRRKARPFRVEQVDAMIDSGAYTRTRDMITICALTGLRIGEVVRIRGEDIDRDGMLLSARRKGGLEHRIAVTPELLQVVERYPASGWWFPSTYKNAEFPDGGGHILMRSASDAISKAIRRAGITDRNLTGHSLRHYYATTLLRQGADIRVVQELLGHASLATTQLYLQVDDDDMRKAVALVPAIALRKSSGRRARAV